MSQYVVYFVNASGHIVDCEVLAACATETEAQLQAAGLLQERQDHAGILLWQGRRQILELMREPRERSVRRSAA